MKDVALQNFYQKALLKGTGKPLRILQVDHKAGGCISHAAELSTHAGKFFIKWGEAGGDNMFAKEQKGLELLINKSRLKIPLPLSSGKIDHWYYILMEALETTPHTAVYWENLGEGLAELHQHTAKAHGLPYDNYIGRLKQRNTPTTSWTEFFIKERLDAQLALALNSKLVGTKFAQKFSNIYPKIPELIPELPPSLLHGDLWSGNIIATTGGKACLIDPAVYYGSREMELAFTHLFGGFDPQFYTAYEEASPIPKGFKERIPIYNLYPLMVHANMFGAAYLNTVKRTIDQLQ